jgi:hypothetical protein
MSIVYTLVVPNASNEEYTVSEGMRDMIEGLIDERQNRFGFNLRCPISQDLIKDPVTDSKGKIYERDRIQEWYRTHSTCPLTNEVMTNKQLTDAPVVKYAIVSVCNEIRELISNPVPAQRTHSQSRAEMDAMVNPNDYTVNVKAEIRNSLLTVTLDAPNAISTTPTDIVLLVDVSGSMCQEAFRPKDGKALNRNYLTSHYTASLIEYLTSNDRLSIILFDHEVKTIVGLQYMTGHGLEMARDSIQRIEPNGGTAIWRAVSAGLEALDARSPETMDRNAAIILMTDGDDDSVDMDESVARYFKRRDNTLDGAVRQRYPIFTVGISNDVKSTRITPLNRYTKSPFSFIFNGASVNRVGNPLMAGIATTAVTDVVVEVRTQNGVTMNTEFPDLIGYNSNFVNGPTYVSGMIGRVCFEQPRHYSIELNTLGMSGRDLDASVSVTVRYKTPGVAGLTMVKVNEIDFVESDEIEDEERTRYTVLKELNVIVDHKRRQCTNAGTRVSSIISLLESRMNPSEFTLDMIDHVRNEVTKAADNFGTWGYHYLTSFRDALVFEFANNAFDTVLNHYKRRANLFKFLYCKYNEIFVLIDNVHLNAKVSRLANVRADTYTPVVWNTTTVASTTSVTKTTVGAAMTSVDDSCVHGLCSVQTPFGPKLVRELFVGDLVMTSGGYVPVSYIVRSECRNSESRMVTFDGGLRITPYHPVFVDGRWQFPIDVIESSSIEDAEFVYSFVVRGGVDVIVNGVPCITLGHGIQNDPVATHAFLGTNAVIENLERLAVNGLVQLRPGSVVRDETGLISGFN